MKDEKIKNMLTSINYTELDPNSTYLFQLDVGEMPSAAIRILCHALERKLMSYDVKNVIIYPYSKDRNPKIEIVKIKEK